MRHNFFFSLLVILCVALTPGFALGATIHGTAYSYDLDKISNVLIEINSTPKQTLYATDGDYSLELPRGTYRIVALSKDDSGIQRAEETILIYDDGKYNIDLFLMTVIEDDYENVSKYLELDSLPNFPQKKDYSVWIIILSSAILVVIAFTAALLLKKKSNTKKTENKTITEKLEKKIDNKEHNLKETILEEITNMDGRATQKELRKKIPFSESKISLVITELEHEGKIRKIKKGRGNILIINK